VRESDLRVLFKRQADIDLPPAPFSIPAVRRIGRARLLRRRASAFGSPVLAAAAVVAVVLAGPFATGPRHSVNTLGGQAAPRTFDPLVPYAAVTWYPYRPSVVSSLGWHTGLLLRASSRSPAKSTAVVLYAAGWCTLKSASLSCGSTPSGTSVELTVSGQAPDVQGRPAYWTRYAGGALAPMRPLSGTQMLAFQYARGGWAVVGSDGTPADVLRVAASLRYGQTSPLRFPFRLTGLPRAWSEVLAAGFTHAGPGAQVPTENVLLLGSPATRLGTAPHNTLTILTGSQTIRLPQCQTRTVPGGQPSQVSKPASCPSKVINGYRVYLNSPPVAGKQTLLSPDADGLYLNEQTTGPGAQLSPASVLANHLHLLGPDPANWTTAPVSP
jgi:hypothetical protein